MAQQKEIEIIEHSHMDYLNIFLVEMSARTPHGHTDLEIGILLEGTMDIIVDENHYSLKKNDIYIISRYQVHSFQRTAEKALILAFQIQDSFYRKINSRLHYLSVHPNILPDGQGALHQVVTAHLLSCARWYFSDSPYRDLKCASTILDTLYALFAADYCSIMDRKEADQMKQNTVRLNHFTDYINEHFAEPISLDDLAELEHISPYYASHYFKENLGISFQDYLNNIRFRHAYHLVRHTDLKIMDICMESGFSSSRYLNQMFVQRLGMTVKEYKKAEVKPLLHVVGTSALPAMNRQNQYSFEQSALLFRKYQY